MARPDTEITSERERERRESILEAARDVFQRYGYRKVTMEDVASAAGITRPTLYKYFKGKKVLLAKLIEWEATMALASNIPPDYEEASCPERLQYLFLAINDYLDKNPFLRGIARRDPDIVTPEVIKVAQKFERAMTEVIAGILEEGMKEGTIYETEPELLAYAVVRSHEAFFLSGFVNDSRYKQDQIIRFFEGFMDNALTPRARD